MFNFKLFNYKKKRIRIKIKFTHGNLVKKQMTQKKTTKREKL